MVAQHVARSSDATIGQHTGSTAVAPRSRARWLGGFSAAILDVAVLFFAAWTLAYQAALWFDWSAVATGCVALVLTALGVMLRYRDRKHLGVRGGDGEVLATQGATAAAVALGGGVVAALLGTTLGQPKVAVVLMLLGSLAGMGYLLRRPENLGRPRAGSDAEPSHVALWPVAWAWSLVFAAVAAWHRRPDGDDVYFVNLSTWVRDNGRFPTRDTLFGDQVWPAFSSHSPPVHSWEGLLGSVARLLDISAPSATYVLAVPVLAVLAVLALARLIEVADLPASPLALSAVLVTLLASGATGASYGNFHILRIWQGKAAFVAVIAPLLVAAAIRYARHGGPARLLLLFAAVVSAIGMTNTTVLLLPVFLCGLLPAVWVCGGLRRVVGLALPLAYALGVGLVVAAFGTDPIPLPPEPVDQLEQIPADASAYVLTMIPGSASSTALMAFAIAAGWLGLRDRVARLVVVGITGALALLLQPPVLEFVAARTDATAVLWRAWWVLPVPLLIGGLVGLAARAKRMWAPVLAVSTAVVVAFTPLLDNGQWITDQDNGTFSSSPRQWKVLPGTDAKGRFVIASARPGELVVAPWNVDRIVAIASSEVHAVSPRIFYLSTFAGLPEFHYRERRLLQRFADGAAVPADELAPALDVLGVRTVCIAAGRRSAERALRRLSFERLGAVEGLRCWRR
jgi:hypothetical protein